MRDFLAFVSLFVEKSPMTAWVTLVRRFAKGVFSRSAARYFVRSMFAARWSPMQIFAEENPIPATPFAHLKGDRWAWGHRSALNALRKALKPSCADTALACLAQCGHFDAEAMRLVRTASLTTKADRVRRAAFAYFQSALAADASSETVSRAISAIGDFLYCPSGELRLQAATTLAARGDTRWTGVITGAQRDFERLAAVKDDEHEDSIRVILSSAPSDRHERELRRILFARAR